jgi:hypothetical protein
MSGDAVAFTSRDVRHFPHAGVSIGVDVKDGQARVALACVNRRRNDVFSRRGARDIINLRFDGSDTLLRAAGMKRQVAQFPYSGTTPRNDILQPIKQELQTFIKAREGRIHGISVQEMYRTLQCSAKQRQRYFRDGPLPGVTLDEKGMPVPAICPLMDEAQRDK